MSTVLVHRTDGRRNDAEENARIRIGRHVGGRHARGCRPGERGRYGDVERGARIPGLTVDVCVDGTKAIPDFAPGDVVRNVELTAGGHTFKIVAQGDPCDGAGILVVTTPLKGGKNYTAVANLNASGTRT